MTVHCPARDYTERSDNHRGGRLGTCPNDGSRLQGPTTGRPSPSKGRKYERCARCDRRGLNHRHPHSVWVPKSPAVNAGPFPAGSPACWACGPVPAARADHATVLHSVIPRLGPRNYDRRLDQETWDILEAASRRIPAACPVCISVGWRDGRFHIGPYLYERGAALFGSCSRCGHTILLAVMTSTEIAEQGPGLLAEARKPDPRCAAGHHDEVTAPEGVFTYVNGRRVPAGTRYCARERCGTILGGAQW
jgi:hypothetical protein